MIKYEKEIRQQALKDVQEQSFFSDVYGDYTIADGLVINNIMNKIIKKNINHNRAISFRIFKIIPDRVSLRKSQTRINKILRRNNNSKEIIKRLLSKQ